MRYSLNSIRGGHTGDYMGSIMGVIKRDTRSLDYDSYGTSPPRQQAHGCKAPEAHQG